MKVQHDRDADALYIEFSGATPLHGIDVPGVEGVSVDVDREGRVVGIEILDVGRRVPGGLGELTFEDLVSEQSHTLTLEDRGGKRKASTRRAS